MASGTANAGLGDAVITLQTMSAGAGLTVGDASMFYYSGGRVAHVHDTKSSANATRFRELAKQWRRATAHFSSDTRMAAHPAYRAIVKMGWTAVPLLIAELRRKPNHWFIALEEITGENPVPPESDGDIRKMAEAWIEWAEKRRV